MRKCLWYSVLTILCTLSSIFAYAQDKLITGRVTDASEEALPGVSISVKNKKAATISDAKGEYKIKASTGDILVFSSVGYVKVEKTVSAATTKCKFGSR
jgi:hypothetical protein